MRVAAMLLHPLHPLHYVHQTSYTHLQEQQRVCTRVSVCIQYTLKIVCACFDYCLLPLTADGLGYGRMGHMDLCVQQDPSGV